MAVANPEMHRSWGEYKREIEENRRRRVRWMQRVMRYARQEESGENEKTQQESEDEEEEDDNVSDGEVVQDSREEQRKFTENQERGDGFEQCLGAMGKEVGSWQEIGIERRMHQLDNMERLVQGSQDIDFERQMHELDNMDRLQQRNQDIDFERQMHELDNRERHVQESQDTDFERRMHRQDNMERLVQENRDIGFERRTHELDDMARLRQRNQSIDFEKQTHELDNKERLGQENRDIGFERRTPELDNTDRLRQRNQSIDFEKQTHELDNKERLGQENLDTVFERRTHELDNTDRLRQRNQDSDFERQTHELDNMERPVQENQGTDFERQMYEPDEMDRLYQRNQDIAFERQMHLQDNLDMLSRGNQNLDFELDNSEILGQENQEASARKEHDFKQENASVRQHLEAFESSEDNESEQNNSAGVQEEEVQRFVDNDVVRDNLEDVALDSSMGGVEVEGTVQNDNHIPSEVHLKERESPEEEDPTKNEGNAGNCGQQLEHDSGFDSPNSVSSDSESGEPYTQASYNNNTTENKDIDLNRVEDFAEKGCGIAPTQEDEVEDDTKQTKDGHLEEDDATTTDEDDDILGDADMDCYDLDEIKMYTDEHHATKLFQTLKDFKDAKILTDLELKTSDGRSAHVHAIVLSGVSYFARRFLGKRHSWDKKCPLIKVDEEVEYKALEAVIEFAYTGAIRELNSVNAYEIKAAARYLGSPKVMEVCDRELAKSKGRPERKSLSASSELKISLQKIRELWTFEMGCDITLDVLSASFEVHKVFLAACSDYFRAMFTLGMKESSQSSVYLQFLPASELEALLDCSYTGIVPLSWNCIFEITSTALQLQHQPVLDLCLKFLQKEINPYCCLDVVSFAEAFGMVTLLDFADDYILRQFQKVARTPKFKDLPARNLFRYLNSFALCVPSELVVFRAVVDWIQAKPKRRLRLAKELMKTIHFPLMTFKDFKEVQALKMWSDHSLQELYEAIFEDFCSSEIETQSKCRIYLPKESLVLSGGDQISEDLGTRSISKDLWFGNSLRNHTGIKKAMEWRKLGEMPQPARFSHEVAVLNGQLYVVGGKKYYGTGDTLNSVLRYDPLENSWVELAAMLQARCCFSLVVFQSKLYAIGGQCHPDYTDTVERYCPTANSWSYTCPLDLPLGGHVARVLAGEIFISGGLNNDYECVSSMFSYDPEKGCTYLENMCQPRSLHSMEVLGDCLYVAGGLSRTDNGSIIDMLACEMYNPLADSWTSFPPLPVPHVGSGSAVLEGKFYVLGGYSQEDYSDIKMVHRYDPATQQWENMGKMPGPNNDLRACVLCLPEHLRICPD